MWDSFRKDKGSSSGGSDSFSGTSMAVRCYESHPTLKLGKGILVGGSARYPVVKDADVYVALQFGDTCGRISDPWEKNPKIVEVQYSIRDMHAPENVTRFKKMVTWLCNQLQDGKTVHVGCIGGHGRTGTVVSAIVAEITGKTDAIQWVRKHYCKKAVESSEQVKFLMTHYGVEKVVGAKQEPSIRSGGNGKSSDWPESIGKYKSSQSSSSRLVVDEDGPKSRKVPEGVTSRTRSFSPMASGRSIWKNKNRKQAE